jgi:signal transduction histidine kinase
MKKFLVIAFLFLLSAQLFGNNEPKWKNEDDNFQFYLRYYIPSKSYTFKNDIRIQVKGDFSKADSASLENFVNELRPLIQRVKIYLVDSGANFTIEINKNAVKQIQSAIDYCKLTDRSYYEKHIGQNHSESFSQGENFDIKSITKTFQVYPDCPQEILNKFLINQLVDGLVNERTNSPVVPELKSISKFSSANIQSDSICTKGFNEIDKYILYNSYSEHPILHLIKKHPKYYSRIIEAHFGENYQKYLNSIALILILLYLAILLRHGILERPALSWKGFIFKWMLIIQSVALLQLVGVIHNELFHYSFFQKFLSVLFSILVINIIGFIFLNWIYFIEKALIRDSTKFASKLLIQLFTTALPFLICFIFTNRDSEFFILVFYSLIIISIRLGYNYVQYKTQNAIMEKDVELANLRELQHKTELQALHSRINPHFLYNSLNSLASLAKTNPSKTEEMALSLSDFCRYAINKQNETFSTVEEEIAIAKTYMAIEQIRFSERLQFTFEVDNDCLSLRVPRFIIQPLLENAVKHGISQITGQGVIILKINNQEDGIIISVADNGPDFPEMLTTGYGLQSIFDKLEILYKGKAKINREQSPEKKISIFIPKTHSSLVE